MEALTPDLTTSAELAASLGLTRPTVRKWGRSWLAPAKVGRRGREALYNAEIARRLIRLHAQGSKSHTAVPPVRPAKVKTPSGLLFGLGEVASFLGVHIETARACRSEFASAVEVRGAGAVDSIYSAEKVARAWEAHLERTKERRAAARSAMWDKICPVPEGSVRGSRAASAAIGMDRRTFMLNSGWFRPAVVFERKGVKCYDPDRLRELWEAKKKLDLRRNSDEARRRSLSYRPASIPEGTALGGSALAEAIGIKPGTVVNHTADFAPARLTRYGRAWLYDTAKAADIWRGVCERAEKARRQGHALYYERRRRGLYQQSKNQRRKAAKL